jgi:hypothetical protein
MLSYQWTLNFLLAEVQPSNQRSELYYYDEQVYSRVMCKAPSLVLMAEANGTTSSRGSSGSGHDNRIMMEKHRYSCMLTAQPWRARP